ncbi:hypothetical protein [Lactococcus garvieae]|uniref:hypothetical protein n=1 Tax=Lactococcus garvieae TaxID=1363 RepID=UPI000266E13C|nr:hypothetical protein [Lactococcus garvieae]EIT66517.1 Hypothetical protein ygdE [Lactococcus garvieae IPLA 31405]
MVKYTNTKRFIKFPNAELAKGITNDELIVYGNLVLSQQLGFYDNQEIKVMTTVPLLMGILGWETSYRASKGLNRLFDSLNKLKSRDLIEFDTELTARNKDMFYLTVNSFDETEKVELDFDWSSSKRIFSGFTKVSVEAFNELQEGYDLAIYIYAKYRQNNKFVYRISFEEWALILSVAKSNAFKAVKESNAVIPLGSGYDTETNKRETMAYVTFDSVEAEKVVVEEDVAEKVKNVIEGDKLTDNLMKKVSDERVVGNVKLFKEIQDKGVHLTVEALQILKDTTDVWLAEQGSKKIKAMIKNKKGEYVYEQLVNKMNSQQEVQEARQAKAQAIEERRTIEEPDGIGGFSRFTVESSEIIEQMVEAEYIIWNEEQSIWRVTRKYLEAVEY